MSCLARVNPARRHGFTMIELVLSLAIMAILLTGMSGAIMIATRSIETAGDPAAAATTSRDLAGEIATDMHFALGFAERSPVDVAFTVPDRDGDGSAEIVRYAWYGTPGVSAGPLRRQYNKGPEITIAEDVDKIEFTSIEWTAPAAPPEPGVPVVLMVVVDGHTLLPSERARTALLRAWGYAVTYVGSNAAQPAFDSQVAQADVVYIPAHVGVVTGVGTTLRNAAVGIVNEPAAFDVELGLRTTGSPLTHVGTEVDVVNDQHPITACLPTGALDVLEWGQTLTRFPAPIGNAVVLAESEGHAGSAEPTLATIDDGVTLAGGGTAAARRVFLPWGDPTFDIHALNPDGRTILYGALESARGRTNAGPKTILFVVTDPASPTAQEVMRQDLMASWGYGIELIDDGSSQASYDAALPRCDAVYVSEEVSSTSVGLKLTDATIGIVNEEPELTDELGISSSRTWPFGSDLTISDATHYITSTLSDVNVTIVSTPQSNAAVAGTPAPGLVALAIWGGTDKTLGVLETGASLYTGGTAAGRRVQLPWGGGSFDFATLTADGKTIMRRSIEWAMGDTAPPDLPPPPDVLLVVGDAGVPSAKALDRQSLVQSWGFGVTMISQFDTPAAFDTAAAGSDVAWITEEVSALQVGTKLLDFTIGVVNEEYEFVPTYGFAYGPAILTRNEIEIRDNAHYITTPFALGVLPITTGSLRAVMMTDPYAEDLQVLSETVQYEPTSIYRPSLGVIDPGGTLYGGGSAAGRRVQLPWGSSSFDINTLNDDGQTLLKRSLEWGAGVGGDQTFGYATAFPTPVSSVRRKQIATQASLAHDGTVTSITAYVYKNRDARFAIYTDDAGEPGSLVVESSKLKPANGPGWSTFDVTPTHLTAGTYWLALAFSDSGQEYHQESVGETRYRNHDAVGSGYLGSWGASDDSFSIKISIYATYTPD